MPNPKPAETPPLITGLAAEAAASITEWLDQPAADDRFASKREVMLDAAACEPGLMESWLQMAWKRGHAAGKEEA